MGNKASAVKETEPTNIRNIYLKDAAAVAEPALKNTARVYNEAKKLTNSALNAAEKAVNASKKVRVGNMNIINARATAPPARATVPQARQIRQQLPAALKVANKAITTLDSLNTKLDYLIQMKKIPNSIPIDEIKENKKQFKQVLLNQKIAAEEAIAQAEAVAKEAEAAAAEVEAAANNVERGFATQQRKLENASIVTAKAKAYRNQIARNKAYAAEPGTPESVVEPGAPKSYGGRRTHRKRKHKRTHRKRR